MSLKDEIKNLIQGDVSDDKQSLDKYSRDASLFEVRPQLAVAPKDAGDIKALVSYVSAHPEQKLSLTARSGGTDMTGGPLNRSVIVDMARYMNRVKEVGGGFAVTEPGAYYRDFEKETLKHGLLMPSYPASREICTVGGMVANNSGGEKSLTYGQTKDYVSQLKVVLRDGNEYTVRPLAKPELDAKMSRSDPEGEIYRSVFELVDKNKELIRKARPAVSKNSAGYFLWDVWDGNTFDLTRLFTGSQGTLGIITEIKFRLVRPKPHSKLLVIFLKDLNVLPELVDRVLRNRPESFESFDDKTLSLTLRFLPEFVKLLGAGNLLSLAWQFLPEFGMFLAGGLPKLILLAEFTGDTVREVDEKAQAAYASIRGLKIRARITKSEQEAKKYWTIRRESFNVLRRHVRGRQTAPFIDDFIINPAKFPEFLPRLERILEPYRLTYSIAGHVGNGNFHIIPLMNLSDPKTRQVIPELSRKVYDLILQYHGSITAEHNDGLIRSPFLEKMYGPEVYRLFGEVKRIFDPDNIFNPGKKVGASFEYAMEHLKKS